MISYSYSGDNIEVYLERGDSDSFVDAELLTDSGSGVILSSHVDVID